MTNKIVQAYFDRMEVELMDRVGVQLLSDDIQQVLTRLMGWHDGSERFKLVRVDTDGRLYVSTSPTQASEATNSLASLTTTPSTVLAANPSRKQYFIYNEGADTVYLAFGSTLATTTAFIVPSGGVMADDIYTGIIVGRAVASTASLRVVEM